MQPNNQMQRTGRGCGQKLLRQGRLNSRNAPPLIWGVLRTWSSVEVTSKRVPRPRGVTFLTIFFGLGTVASLASCVSLLTPGGPLEPMWRLNPRAREAFTHMGWPSAILLAGVSVACASAAVGLWWARPWGYRVAVSLLLVNLVGDVLNGLLGVEPRALLGVPIVVGLLLYLASGRVRWYFWGPREG